MPWPRRPRESRRSACALVGSPRPGAWPRARRPQGWSRAPGEQELDHVRDVAAGGPGKGGRAIIVVPGGDVGPGVEEDRRAFDAVRRARPRPSRPQRSCRGVAFCQSGRSGSMPLSSRRRSSSGSLQRYDRQAVTMGGTRAPASSSRITRSRLPRVQAAVNTPPQPEWPCHSVAVRLLLRDPGGRAGWCRQRPSQTFQSCCAGMVGVCRTASAGHRPRGRRRREARPAGCKLNHS